MPPQARRPTLSDLVHLSRQLEADRHLPEESLRRRDHAIGQRCRSRERIEALLYWLDQVDTTVPAAEKNAPGEKAPLHEKQWAVLLRLLALLFGASGMAGFLLASERALVNVPLFLLLFVILQFLLCLLAAWLTWNTLRGRPPASLPFNPSRLILRHAMAHAPVLREAGGVGRLLLLRYGQELGALFASGAIAAFMVLLSVTDFSFVWGSTFTVSDRVVEILTRGLSAPWHSVFPAATVSPETIAETRFLPAQRDLGGMPADSRRAWWPFLFACLLCYTLLPRLLLWMACLLGFRRQLRGSLLGLPGVNSVLARMRSPVVETRALEPEAPAPADERFGRSALLDWAGALEALSEEQSRGLPLQDRQLAGLGSPADDVAAISAIRESGADQLLVLVRGWEPPMADLADVLAEVSPVQECILLLASLPGRELGAAQVGDWQRFAAGLPFASTRVEIFGGSPT